MTALKPALALLFRRAAASEVAEEVLVRQASLDLHWFSPKDARRFLEVARGHGLLKPGGKPGTLTPTFAIGEVEVPLDFRIDASALDGVPTTRSPIAEELVERAAALRGVSAEELWAEVDRKQHIVLVERPAAAALVAAESGVDLKPYFARIASELAELSRAAGATPSSS